MNYIIQPQAPTGNPSFKMLYHLTSVEEDILEEIISIGMAKVADSLAFIARENVWLHYPLVTVLQPNDIDSLLPDNEREDFVVQSDIKGDLNGATFILFRRKQAECLSEICIDESARTALNKIVLQRSLLLEISNILTGSLVTQFANIFKLNLIGYPPMFVPFGLRQSFSEVLYHQLSYRPFALTIKTDFLNSGVCVELPMLIIFDQPSLEAIVRIIRYLNSTNTNWLQK